MLRAVTLALVLVTALPGAARAQTHRALFVGNSYTGSNKPHNLTGSFAILGPLLTPGWDAVETAERSPGGYTIGKHADDADGTNGDTKLRQLLVTDGATWDLVVLQDQSQVPGFGAPQPQYLDSLAGAKTLAALAGAAGATPVLFMTWGYRSGDSLNDFLFPDYSTMQGHLQAGYEAYAANAATPELPVYVAPVGLAFQQIHDAAAAAGGPPDAPGTAFHALYAGDGSHPSQRGSYLAACVMFVTVTGRSVAALEWYPGDDVPADAQAELRSAADAAVLGDPWTLVERPWGSVTRFAWVHAWSGWAPASGPVEIDGQVQRPHVFVDGAHSADSVRVGDGVLALRGPDATLVVGGVEVEPSGALLLEAGVLRATTITAHSLDHRGGELQLEGEANLATGYTLAPDATLSLFFDAAGSVGRLTVGGAATLSGTLRATGEAGPEGLDVALVTAESLDASALTIDTSEAPGAEVVVTPTEVRLTMAALEPPAEPPAEPPQAEPSEQEPPAEEGAGDPEPPVPAAPDLGAVAEPDAPAAAASSGGCESSSGRGQPQTASPGMLLLALLVGALWVGRKRATRASR